MRQHWKSSVSSRLCNSLLCTIRRSCQPGAPDELWMYHILRRSGNSRMPQLSVWTEIAAIRRGRCPGYHPARTRHGVDFHRTLSTTSPGDQKSGFPLFALLRCRRTWVGSQRPCHLFPSPPASLSQSQNFHMILRKKGLELKENWTQKLNYFFSKS